MVINILGSRLTAKFFFHKAKSTTVLKSMTDVCQLNDWGGILNLIWQDTSEAWMFVWHRGHTCQCYKYTELDRQQLSGNNQKLFITSFSLAECKADCDTCFNKNFCTKCKSGFYLHLGKCLDNCPEGLEANNHTMECVSIGEEAPEGLLGMRNTSGDNSVSVEVLLKAAFHKSLRDRP